MLTTDSGIIILVNPVQLANAYAPIDFNLFGSSIEVIFEQPLNTLFIIILVEAFVKQDVISVPVTLANTINELSSLPK